MSPNWTHVWSYFLPVLRSNISALFFSHVHSLSFNARSSSESFLCKITWGQKFPAEWAELREVRRRWPRWRHLLRWGKPLSVRRTEVKGHGREFGESPTAAVVTCHSQINTPDRTRWGHDGFNEGVNVCVCRDNNRPHSCLNKRPPTGRNVTFWWN